MQRVLRIVLIITFMLLLILWFSTIFNTCNKKNNEELTSEQMDEVLGDSTDVFSELGDEFFEDDQGVLKETESSENVTNLEGGDDVFGESSSESVSDPYSDPEEFTDYTGSESSSETVSNSTNSGNTTVTTANDNAAYLIVAGSFLVKDNADRLKNKLVKMGYTAEVKSFDYSQYYSVIAGRYNSRSSANNIAAELKSRGIDCLVQKRKY